MFRKTLVSLAAALSISCSGAIVRNDIPDEPQIEAPEQEVIIGVKDAERLPGFIEVLPESNCMIFNEKGEVELIGSFFTRSKNGAAGMNYAKGRIEEIRRIDNNSISPLELAVKGVDLIRKDLSVTNGRGFATMAHEANRNLHSKIDIKIPWINIRYIHETEVIRPADSTQLFSDFISYKSGKYEGDCDDFARSLLAAYEIMRDIAKANEGDKFYGKLYRGLRRYKIIGLDIEGHAMNASLTYNEDFTRASVEVIEPQVYDYSSSRSNIAGDELHVKEGFAVVARAYKKPRRVKNYLVWRIYDSESCYALTDLLK